jgi:hypothetical protein
MDEMSGTARTLRNLHVRKIRPLGTAIQSEQFGAGMPNLVLFVEIRAFDRFPLTRGYCIRDYAAVPKPPSQPAVGSAGSVSPHDVSRISRRDFGRHAAVAAALALSPGTLIGSPQDSDPRRKLEASLPNNRGDGLTPEQREELEAKLTNIIRKYGNRLSDDQRAHLRRILTYNEKMLASVRSFPLQNGDPPASVLKVSFLEQTTSSRLHAAAHGEALRLR